MPNHWTHIQPSSVFQHTFNGFPNSGRNDLKTDFRRIFELQYCYKTYQMVSCVWVGVCALMLFCSNFTSDPKCSDSSRNCLCGGRFGECTKATVVKASGKHEYAEWVFQNVCSFTAMWKNHLSDCWTPKVFHMQARVAANPICDVLSYCSRLCYLWTRVGCDRDLLPLTIIFLFLIQQRAQQPFFFFLLWLMLNCLPSLILSCPDVCQFWSLVQ